MAIIWAICRRDLRFLFTTPLAWLVLFGWTGFLNLVFCATSLLQGSDHQSLHPLYLYSITLGAYALTLVAPAITMNSFATERGQGTLQLLLTVPIREYQLVIGKYLALLGMLWVLLAFTLVQPVVLYFVSDAGGLQTVGSYLGLALLCSLLAALGLWISILVEHPLAAFVITAAIVAVFQVLGLFAEADIVVLSPVGRQLGLPPRFEAFFAGDLQLDNILYFLAGTVIFLVLGHGAICARRVHG